MTIVVRDYLPVDEERWLRCRVLAFIDTAYFDDVARSKPAVRFGVELVAEARGEVAGVLDISVDGAVATIDTVAVHPDFRRMGVATALLAEGIARARSLAAHELDAWTRDDAAALDWYRANGFAEGDHYLHVYADRYADPAEPARAVAATPGLDPVRVFLHGRLEDEARWRAAFTRVYVCRRFVRDIR